MFSSVSTACYEQGQRAREPPEADAAGALAALAIAVAKRSLSRRNLREVLVETGHIAASILFLIIAASMYSRMLGVAGLPTQLGG